VNVLQISTTDGIGGAGRAARRLHQALASAGVDSHIAAGRVDLGGRNVVGIPEAAGGLAGQVLGAERILPRLNRITGEVPFPFPSTRLLERTAIYRRADVIHLHNLHGGYFDYRVLPRWAALRPIVWSLHDMWPLSGHCAYSYGCARWRTGCGSCPLFSPDLKPLDEIAQPPWDNSAAEWRRRDNLYTRTPLTVVAPSRWLLSLASQSHLAAHPETSFHHVPHGLDSDLYAPTHRPEARRALGIDPERPALVFGSASFKSERKGFRYLLEALSEPELRELGLQLLTIGPADERVAGRIPELHAFGGVSDERSQALIFSAADLAVVPSLAENQPLVALEAMSCGTAVVAFAVGGLPELVRDLESGLCVPERDSRALARAISRLLGDRELLDRLSDGARRQVLAEHRLADFARAYRDVYAGALHRRRGDPRTNSSRATAPAAE